MKFKLRTLVDITESGVRRGPDKVAVGQQSNYDTIIQVIGLRANPDLGNVFLYSGSLLDLGFGKKITKKKHSYWEVEFEVPEGTLSIDDLQEDFNLVPFINDLNETFNINISAFQTKNDDFTNIVFEKIT